MEFIIQIITVLLLVLLNAYFVASEFALVSIRKTRINELVQKGSQPAKLVQRAINNLDTYISATQLGITLASLALGWMGEPALANFLESTIFRSLPEVTSSISSHTFSIIIAFSMITFLHIVLGELAPKTIALQRSELVSLLVIVPLSIFATIFKPAIWLLNGAGNTILKVIGFNPTGYESIHSEEEIKMILVQSGEGGIIPSGEVEMVQNVFKLGDIPVKQIMVPRSNIIAFDINTTLETIARSSENYQFSRYPVYNNSLDDILGFIHIKDIYRGVIQHKEKLKLSQFNIIRKVIIVPETKKADTILSDMKKKRIHLAIILDKYGGTLGLVTLEDILESLVGEILDEFDYPETNNPLM